MSVRRIWTGLAVVCVLGVPALTLTDQVAFAAGAPKAEWRSGKGAKAPVKSKTKAKAPVPAPAATPAAKQVLADQPVAAAGPTTEVVDQSQEVLDIDFAMAASIAAQGPKNGYASALSDEGVLYDANGPSPAGQAASASRFGTFPADVALVRAPESALAAGGSGSSWGTYTIKRGEAVLSAGRYISVWRREASGWKMISELAAGKTFVPPPANAISGVLPKRPAQLGRASPSPVGVPLTVPTPPVAQPVTAPVTPPASESAAEAPPAP